MKLEKIKKMNSGKYKIEFSDNSSIITYDEVILKHNLLFDKQITNEQLNELNIDTKYYDNYNKCLKYIGRRLRSEKEIFDYLSKLDVDKNDLNKIISDLKKINLINDRNFTKAYISDHIYLSNDGLDKIRKELVNHNIDLNIIEDEISKIDDTIIKEKLSKLIEKKVKSNHKYSGYMLRKKIYNDMINLGYSSYMINECYDLLELDDSEDLKKEFEKLYRKLYLKETEDNLYLKIRQKLYQKGYNLSQIDSLIEEKRDSN